MKIQTLKRGNTASRECTGDLRRTVRNLDPKYHPMQRAREYTRAVTAAKMSRMFAKPLIGNLGHGHRDAVICSAISRRSLVPLVSGCADGTVSLWDLASRKNVTEISAHSRTVTGVCFDVAGQSFYSCSDDGYVHRWNIHPTTVTSTANDESKPPATTGKRSSSFRATKNQQKDEQQEQYYGPVTSFRTAGSFKSIDHHWHDDVFCTASDSAVQIWSPTRTTPISSYSDLWGNHGHDTVTCCRFNPTERDLLAHCAADRGVGLHDTRTNCALRKTVLQMKCNDLQWNPMEPYVFCVGNEDYNAYTFDMRYLKQPSRIYKGHAGAVLSVSWSPTGQEFVTGSYDRTLRIFNSTAKQGNCRARDVYHTKRMQRVFTVQYTMDSKYIVCGSDESNLRLWKANASEQLGQKTTREEAAMSYRSSLIDKYKHMPEVRNISQSRKIPKGIKTQTKQAQVHKASQARKHANRVKYSSKKNENELHKFIPERKKTVVKEVE